jgi:hypothetical protein
MFINNMLQINDIFFEKDAQKGLTLKGETHINALARHGAQQKN